MKIFAGCLMIVVLSWLCSAQSSTPVPQPGVTTDSPDAPDANPARPTVSTPATLPPVGYVQFETGGLGAVTSP
jgi:hypothetical protein